MDVFKNFTKVIKIRDVLIDNGVFQLHYRFTAPLLLICSALVASKQHFGDPIDCITKDDVPNKIMDTYCWIHSTFTLPSACNKTVGIEVPHPCVDKYNGDREDRVYQKYYQWVYFVLFFQAACFYAPHLFWKMKESKLLSQLTEDFKHPLIKDDLDKKTKKEREKAGPPRDTVEVQMEPVGKTESEGKEIVEVAKKKPEEPEDSEKVATAKRVVKYLYDNRRRHPDYFYFFITCEIWNLINVITQIYVVDEFLGGTFTSYGLDVISYVQLDQYDRVDPMVRIFPRMTKCTFHRYGASGDVQKYDALCILPLNIINEKIYIVMWFWFVILAAITSVWLVYRLLTLTQWRLRYSRLRRMAFRAKKSDLKYLVETLDAGNWFMLTMVCKNMDAQWFKFLVAGLAGKLREQECQSKSKAKGGGRSRVRTNGAKSRGVRDDGKERILMNADPESGERGAYSDEEDDDDNISLHERTRR